MVLLNRLKFLHVTFACAWFGSVLAVVLIYLFTRDETSFEVVISNNFLIEKIDHFIIIPTSLACYFSGLFMSWKTHWGFFKFKWIIAKLLIGTLIILFGIFFLGPWILDSAESLKTNIPEYRSIQNKLGISMIIQSLVILFVIFISTTKPWGRMNSN